MEKKFRTFVGRCFRIFGIKNRQELSLLIRNWKHPIFFMKVLRLSTSQLLQDVFVACELKLWRSKKSGFFVEFGATDGKDLSNTLMLETIFNFSGILSEPGRAWHTPLSLNRHCFIETSAVWHTSGLEVSFLEVQDGKYSTISGFEDTDGHSAIRSSYVEYRVPTISLDDLLRKYNAPKQIAFLSIDTEGSEYEILRDFPFLEYSFDVIVVEHNYSPQRQLIYSLLKSHGYKRVCEKISLQDDWYVSN